MSVVFWEPTMGNVAHGGFSILLGEGVKILYAG